MKSAARLREGARTSACYSLDVPDISVAALGWSTHTQVLEVRGNTLILGGADIVDGSPVLDIKPYVPFCDGVRTATAPSWVTVSVWQACWARWSGLQNKYCKLQ